MTDSTQANTVQLRTTISPAFNAALDEMVIASGVAKTALVRQALGDMLVAAGAITPEAARPRAVRRSAGRLSSQNRKTSK